MPQLYLRGKSLGIFDCIIFDKDGTLVYSEAHLLNLAKSRVKEALKIYKKEKTSNNYLEEFRSTLNILYGVKGNKLCPNSSISIGSREQNLISTATIFSIYGNDWPRANQIASHVFKEADEQLHKSNSTKEIRPLLPSALKVLKGLRKSGFKLALITNDNKEGVEEFLDKNNLYGYFQYCWSSDDFPSKPNPNSIKKLCQILKVKSSDCAIISDSDTDLLMGKKNKTKSLLGYTGGWSTPPLIYEYDHLINHWDEINYQ